MLDEMTLLNVGKTKKALPIGSAYGQKNNRPVLEHRPVMRE